MGGMERGWDDHMGGIERGGVTIWEGWRGVDDILPGYFDIYMLSITCTHVHVHVA